MMIVQAVPLNKDWFYTSKEQMLIDLPPRQPSKEPQWHHSM